MDEIAGRISEEVVMQIGETKYKPQNAKYLEFTDEDDFKRLCAEARIVVSHGAMVMMDALEQGTPVIAVPRRHQFGEHLDDHQLYIVQELEKQGKVTAIYDIEQLEDVLLNTKLEVPEFTKSRQLVNALKQYIMEFARN